MSIPFTQYLLPDGRRIRIEIDRPEDVERKAMALIEFGASFESEVLSTGHVSIECVRPSVYGSNNPTTFALVICPNGEAVPDAVDRLVERAFQRLKAMESP